MKPIKVLLAVLVSIVLIAVVAAGALYATFDPNDHKGFVTGWIEARTGRTLTIEGDLTLELFPWLAVETGGVTLGDPEGFDSSEPFATAGRLSAGVKLLPLLGRRVELGRVRIEDLRLDLERRSDGRGNWEDFSADGAAPDPAGGTAAGALVDNLDIEGIDIRDGVVSWREDGGRLRYVASGIRLETGAIRAGAPVDVALAARIRDVESEREFDVDTEAEVALAALGAADAETAVELRDFVLGLAVADGAGKELAAGTLAAAWLRAASDGRVEAGESRLEARAAAADAIPGGLDFGAEWSSARFDPGRASSSVEGLVTRVAGVAVEWRVAGRNLIDAPELEGAFRADGAPLGPALESFGISLPGGPSPDTLGVLDASGEFRIALSLAAGGAGASGEPGLALGAYRVTALEVGALDVSALGARVRGAAELGGDGVLRASVEVPELAPSEALRTILAASAPEALDFAALDRAALSTRIEADLDGGRIALADVSASLLGGELGGSLEILRAPGGGTSRLLYRGALESSRIDPQRLARFLGPLLPAAISPDELGALAADTRFEYDRAADRLTLDPLSLEVFGLAASGRATVSALTRAPAVAGEARIAAFSPRELMRRFGQSVPATSDPAALTRASGSARFSVDSGSGRFEGIDLALDDSRITGDFSVDGFERPGYSFDLAIDRVNADRYLPPRSGDLPEDADPATRTAGDIELPAKALENLDIDGRVRVGELRLAGLDFRGVATDIAVGGGRASLDSARASLYGGEFAGSFRADTTAEPGLALSGRATSLALEPLITALTGDANVSGTGDFDLDLVGRGRTILENVASANGNVTFSMRDGAIEGFNLGRGLCVVYNTTQRLPAPADRPSRTEYQLIRGTAAVENGVAASRDLLARAAFLDLTGAGSLTLAEQRLDYELDAKLTASTGIPGCESMDQLIGESFPLRLRGTVTEPDIRPDFRELLERMLRERLRDRIGERLQDLLR